MSLYQSLYETALKQGLAKPLIDVLVRVFANDVDFQRATAPGDSIEAFFSRAGRNQSSPGASLRHDDGARSGVQVLPIPDAGRQPG